MTPFERPVVPEVYIIEARSSSSTVYFFSGRAKVSNLTELFSDLIKEKSSIRIAVFRTCDLNPSIRDNRELEINIALEPEWSSILAISVGEKSGRTGTTTAPIKVIEKYAMAQFGIFKLRIATLSPGQIPFFSRKAITLRISLLTVS